MSSNTNFSLLIIVKNRQRHVENTLRGIKQSSVLPSEIIIVHMNEAKYGLSSDGVVIKEFELSSDSPLPLAEARNTAAAKATTDQLIFLDADCIPAPTFFENLLRDSQTGQVTMCDPYYLQLPVMDINFEDFNVNAKPNLARKNLTFGLSNQYGLFWSLGFAVQKADFDTIGGFDEQYKGYGAEDTDFGFTIKKAGKTLYFSKAKVFHQPHDTYDPPLNWLEDIVLNAETFYRKWQIWPMEGWLKAFAELGYIDWRADSITVIKLPAEAELNATKR